MVDLPSPASSPSLDPSDSTTQTSRKRPRTPSMQPDASSSSAKRSVSEGAPLENVARTPSSDQISTLTLTELSSQDIDSYMDAQGEADIEPFIALTPPQDQGTSPLQNMQPAEKLAFVDQGKVRKMQPGETWYLVAMQWYKRWRKAVSGEVDKDGPITELELGAVDNSPLLDIAGGLKADITEGIDVEFVPEEVWKAFETWYGTSQSSLPRRVATRGIFSQNAFLELRPLKLAVYRLGTDAPMNLAVGPPYPVIEASISDTVKALSTKLADAVRPNDATAATPYRIYKLAETLSDESWRSIDFPLQKLKESSPTIFESSESRLENADVENNECFVVEFKEAGGWPVDLDNPKGPLAIEGPIFNSNEGFFARYGKASPSLPTVKMSNDSYTPFSSRFTTSLTNNKTYNKPLEPGTLGLGNMGNTCFMNSALQCLAHTPELTEYFTSGVFTTELNRDNPLGMKGAIAEVFGALLDRIWASSGPSNSYSPREFKQTLQKFAPQFSGYQQHDSQELVAFLLDGLHEDLNRVLKKPYVEKPDWEGGGDSELVKLAVDSWNGYMLRNDSVIVDLFQGQYQSTLVCPECSKISITFDPFMYLTLPLPVNRKWRHTIFYVPWDQDLQHVKVPVEISRDASFKELRALLGRWMNANPENLLMMEIFQHKFYKSLDDSVPVSDMNSNDTIVCFELPCNSRQSRFPKKTMEDPFIIPLFLSDAKPPGIAPRSNIYGGGRNQPSCFGYPTVVVIDRETATSVEAIYEAVVARLQRWTSQARDLYDWEVSDDAVTEIPAGSSYTPMESVTEFTPEGEIREVAQPVDEGDITDAKPMVIDNDNTVSGNPRPVRAKRDIFELRLQANNNKDNSYTSYIQPKFETWENRALECERLNRPSLLKDSDGLFCEFDENMKAYYFGEPISYEHARWNEWEEFIHPELADARKNSAQKVKKGLTLEDCLEEFVKEEQLGEDDLWYCPQCKKHQQATKKFDLWKAPDILVVHLKRFSNNRILRDKIDTFVDFPIEGLDLSEKVGERAVARRLRADGKDLPPELASVNLDEPLLYDLFAVDEHMGGLGGGHYRAYSSNHLNGKWYHFDDAYVKPAKPEDAVNSNAYLLFYRRRSNAPLGGKTHLKVEEYKQAHPPTDELEELESSGGDQGQLPTPPNEPVMGPYNLAPETFTSMTNPYQNWRTGSSSNVSSPPDDPPGFDEAQSDPLVSDSCDNIFPYAHGCPPLSDHPRIRKSSPTSSNEAEIDIDGDDEEFDPDLWGPPFTNQYSLGVDNWDDSAHASPTYSDTSGRLEDVDDDLYTVDDPSGDGDGVGWERREKSDDIEEPTSVTDKKNVSA